MLKSNFKTVRTDMNTMIRDAQNLFHEASAATGERAEELRAKGLVLLDAAMAKAQDVQAVAKEAAKTTDEYVHENPWQAVAISAGVGLLVGLLISRR